MAVAAPTVPGATPVAAKGATAAPVVLDLGKQRRKQVKALRRGEGKLMGEVASAIEELRTAGAITANAQPVIVIVQQKRRRSAAGLLPRF